MDSIKINLAVDKSRNRVLFADAGSDLVDVVLSFLTLPLSAIQFCVAPSPGCLSNLCDSVRRLAGGKLLKVDACHGMLLTPSTAHEFGGRVLRLRYNLCFAHDASVKSQPNLKVNGNLCSCWKVMDRLARAYSGASSSPGKFVRCKERFVISDDWTITPACTSLIHRFSSESEAAFPGFEEVEVCVSWPKVISLLKASLSSDTIFTDVFLPMGTGGQDARATMKPSINQKIAVTLYEDPGTSSEFKTKFFYDAKEKKVMYAECKHDFVDLLLGFLAYPLGCVIKNMNDSGLASPLGTGGMANLYASVVELDAAGFIAGGYPAETLLNPPLSPFCRHPDCSAPKKDAVEPKNFMGLVSHSSCVGCCYDLVEDRKYVVDDDLLVHQASAMSVTKHWRGRDKANVVEMDIDITKQEAVVLLRAMLTSKTPLTDVFIGRLEEHST
ncbi:uncharacterized protein [Aegilops tauschii subsp. strangulata]|uniref:uncharacterized protein isoform X1 n=1 Tax=Aegilops tauschii subsp. strangulata TaxID=200361 RepID=UPI001ABC2938|nr:uncharacterized protein LOC109753146 isoform X1 [Aegilops tauschii subsp. strangulata]